MKGHVSLSDVELVSYERGHSDFFKNKRMIIDSMIFLMVTLVLASIGLSFYFYYVAPKTELAHLREVVNNNSVNFDNPYHNWSHSFRFGIFHAISAINNAGFDIIGDNSLMPYYKNIGLQVIIMILFLIGGIGYPVIHDVVNYIRIKSINKNAYYNWSLFTKISVVTYLIVTLFGFIFVISFELSSTDSIFKSNLQYYGNNAYKTWSLLFMVISTRSAGFSTLNLHLLSEPTLWVLGTLMFIGACACFYWRWHKNNNLCNFILINYKQGIWPAKC
nr:potassium transporter TrkG [Mycoplasmopsis bovis]